jgi:hypothetical protein
MGDRRAVSRLVWRCAGDDEPDPVKLARLSALLRQDQVPEMDRVEGAAEKPQSHGEENSLAILTIHTPDQAKSTFLWTNVQKSGELAEEGAALKHDRLESLRMTAAIFDDRPDS